MNLGDGLLFEVENGKPKLIVSSHAAERNLPKLSRRPKAANILSSRQRCSVKEAQSEEQPARRQAGRYREAGSRAGGAAASCTSNTAAGGRSSTLTSSNASKTRTNHTAECSVKAGPKVKSDRPKHNSNTQSFRTNGKAGRPQDTVTLVNDKAGLKDTLANGEAGLKENVVCLTNEQLQQLLNATQASDSRQDPTDDQSTQDEQVALKQQKGRAPEKLQTEDCYHQAMHLDSLKERPLIQASAASGLPPAPPVGPDRAGWEAAPSSLGWEATSSCGAESTGRASVGTTSGFPARASHLRTMTALLDPVQIEEREWRRLKQLEHKRALAAQVEERRQQREQEEARRREEEAEDDRRVALEREKLQRQYQLEVQREGQRKERASHQSESFQTAEPELQGIKQQKNTQLTSSRSLQETQKAGGEQQHCSAATSELGTERHAGQRLEAGGARGAEEEDEVRSSVSQHKDAAVQTEPVSAEYRPPPSSISPPHPPPAPPSGRRRAVRAGKENVCVPEPAGEGGGGGGGGGDPYEAFARTDRSRRDKRPEWNTQRPSRRFVPASERYPAVLQKNRQQSRLRRQAELLALQDRACLSRTNPAPPLPPLPQQQEPNLNPVQTRTRATPNRKVESVTGGQRGPAAGSTERGRSPPVPALRHRQKPLASSSPPAPPSPPTPELVPFFRTEEVINVDPLEPLPAPTDAPQRPSSPLPPPRSSQRDALPRPGLLHNTDMYTQNQQEVLRGLAQLRQILLQEKRQLEADNPQLKLCDHRLWSPLTRHRM